MSRESKAALISGIGCAVIAIILSPSLLLPGTFSGAVIGFVVCGIWDVRNDSSLNANERKLLVSLNILVLLTAAPLLLTLLTISVRAQ